MNHIRFRYWDDPNRRMEYAVRITCGDFIDSAVYYEVDNGYTWERISKDDVIRSIGRKDNNGVDVFAGDRVIHKKNGKVYGGVIEDGDTEFFIDSEYEDFTIESVEDFDNKTVDLEVVGNVYEGYFKKRSEG